MGVGRDVFILTILGFGGYHMYKTQYYGNSTMTWMYETPQYLQMPESSLADTNYKLYLYGEGRYFEQISSVIWEKRCIERNFKRENFHPVLYIPGSGGSYKQSRSIGSVLYKKMNVNFQSPVFDFEFNTFTIDLNEELTGIYGGTLQRQTEFVAKSIEQILSFYPENEKIYIVAHSMGGIIARAVLAQGLVPAEKFAFLISLGSPHQAPVIPERSLVNFTKVTRKNRIFRPEELNCVSVSGGLRDIQVRPALSLSDPCINVRGESVPLTWTSQDHQSLVWDNGLVLATARTIYDIQSGLSNGMKAEKLLKIPEFHFVKKYSMNNNFEISNKAIEEMVNKVRYHDQWETIIPKHSKNIALEKDSFYLVELESDGILRILSTGDLSQVLVVDDGFQAATQLPNDYFMSEASVNKNSEVFVYVKDTATLVFTDSDSSDVAVVPYTMSWFLSIFSYFQFRHPITEVITVLSLQGMKQTYQIFDVSLNQDGVVIFQSNGRNNIISNTFPVSLSLEKGLKEEDKDSKLIVITEKSHRRRFLYMSINFAGVVDILLREYWSVIISFMVVNLLFTTASMMRGKRQTRVFWDVLENVGKPYYICPLLSIAHGAFNKTWLESIVPANDSIFEPDSEKLDDRNLYFSTVYIMSFITSIVLLGTIAKIIYWIIFLASSILARPASFLNFMTSKKYIILPISAILLNLNGALALFPVVLAEFVNLVVIIRKDKDNIMSAFWVDFTKFLFILFEVALLIPPTIFWIKNTDLSQLPIDPSFMPAFLTLIAYSSEFIDKDLNIPRMNIVILLSVITALYCSVNIQRVVYIIPFTLTLLNTRTDLFLITPVPVTD